MQSRWIIVGCVAWCLVSVARADSQAPAAPVPAATTTDDPVEIDSYRLPLGLADTATILFAALGAAGDSDRAVIVGAASFALSGPLIHAAHGHSIRAGVSLALRVGLPLGGSLLGARLGRKSHYHCDFDNICDRSGEDAGRGLFLGMLGAALIDDIGVAQPVEIHKPASTSWAPRFAAGPHQASVDIVGQF